MTTITASVVADSIGERSPRLTTFLLRYPRIIHAEFMTHRVFSRNASSHRAIPVTKLIQNVIDNPFIPHVWRSEKKGMQGGDELSQAGIARCRQTWLTARDHAVHEANRLVRLGLHKSIINRLLEPFSHITVVMTTTQLSNFFVLRRHKDAELHIQILADRMWTALALSKPRLLKQGEWHLPFVDEYVWKTIRERFPYGDSYRDKTTNDRHNAALIHSVACCASTSYKTVEDFEMTMDRALSIYEKLEGPPMHASPFEHQATPTLFPERHHLNGNLGIGWDQFRKTMPGENL